MGGNVMCDRHRTHIYINGDAFFLNPALLVEIQMHTYSSRQLITNGLIYESSEHYKTIHTIVFTFY